MNSANILSNKFLIIIVFCVVSLCAQMNLKSTSQFLPTKFSEVITVSFFILLVRALVISGASLALSWYSYRKFGLLELMVAQALSYVFVIAASIFIYNEPFRLNHLFAVILILSGILLYNAK